MKPDLSQFAKLPRFPDGRINYSGSEKAAVVSCIIKYGNEILLLKRSDKVGNYKGKWNVVAGYLDDKTPIKEKALGEVKEETGITEKNILKVKIFTPQTIKDKILNKTFITYVALIELNSRPEIKLDWEHTEFKWIGLKDVSKFDTIYGLVTMFYDLFKQKALAREITASVVTRNNKILILRRLATSHSNPNKWEFISGFVNKRKNYKKQAAARVEFETSLNAKFVGAGKPFTTEDEGKLYLIHPFLFTASQQGVRLKHHSDFKWVLPKELRNFDCVSDLEVNLTRLSKGLRVVLND